MPAIGAVCAKRCTPCALKCSMSCVNRKSIVPEGARHLTHEVDADLARLLRAQHVGESDERAALTHDRDRPTQQVLVVECTERKPFSRARFGEPRGGDGTQLGQHRHFRDRCHGRSSGRHALHDGLRSASSARFKPWLELLQRHVRVLAELQRTQAGIEVQRQRPWPDLVEDGAAAMIGRFFDEAPDQLRPSARGPTGSNSEIHERPWRPNMTNALPDVENSRCLSPTSTRLASACGCALTIAWARSRSAGVGSAGMPCDGRKSCQIANPRPASITPIIARAARRVCVELEYPPQLAVASFAIGEEQDQYGGRHDRSTGSRRR